MSCGVSELGKPILQCNGNFTSPSDWDFVSDPSSSTSLTTPTLQSQQQPDQPLVRPLDPNPGEQPRLRRRQWRFQPALSDRRPPLHPARPQAPILTEAVAIALNRVRSEKVMDFLLSGPYPLRSGPYAWEERECRLCDGHSASQVMANKTLARQF